MHVHNFEAIVTTFYHIVIYVTADYNSTTFYHIVIYVISNCNSQDVSFIHSPLTFKISYGYELGAGRGVVALSISSHKQTQ